MTPEQTLSELLNDSNEEFTDFSLEEFLSAPAQVLWGAESKEGVSEISLEGHANNEAEPPHKKLKLEEFEEFEEKAVFSSLSEDKTCEPVLRKKPTFDPKIVLPPLGSSQVSYPPLVSYYKLSWQQGTSSLLSLFNVLEPSDDLTPLLVPSPMFLNAQLQIPRFCLPSLNELECGFTVDSKDRRVLTLTADMKKHTFNQTILPFLQTGHDLYTLKIKALPWFKGEDLLNLAVAMASHQTLRVLELRDFQYQQFDRQDWLKFYAVLEQHNSSLLKTDVHSSIKEDKRLKAINRRFLLDNRSILMGAQPSLAHILCDDILDEVLPVNLGPSSHITKEQVTAPVASIKLLLPLLEKFQRLYADVEIARFEFKRGVKKISTLLFEYLDQTKRIQHNFELFKQHDLNVLDPELFALQPLLPALQLELQQIVESYKTQINALIEELPEYAYFRARVKRYVEKEDRPLISATIRTQIHEASTMEALEEVVKQDIKIVPWSEDNALQEDSKNPTNITPELLGGHFGVHLKVNALERGLTSERQQQSSRMMSVS